MIAGGRVFKAFFFYFFFLSIAKALNGWEGGRWLSLGSSHAKIVVGSSISGGGVECGCVHSSLLTMIITNTCLVCDMPDSTVCVVHR